MATHQTLDEQIAQIAEPLAQEMNLELVDVHIGRRNRDTTIQILADRKDGGITVEECSALNKKIGHVIERDDIISGRYIIEVSSPGIDRPLRTKQDLIRVSGREVRFFLTQPFEGKVEYAGTVTSVDDDTVTVAVEECAVAIPMDIIQMAKQVIV